MNLITSLKHRGFSAFYFKKAISFHRFFIPILIPDTRPISMLSALNCLCNVEHSLFHHYKMAICVHVSINHSTMGLQMVLIFDRSRKESSKSGAAQW